VSTPRILKGPGKGPYSGLWDGIFQSGPWRSTLDSRENPEEETADKFSRPLQPKTGGAGEAKLVLLTACIKAQRREKVSLGSYRGEREKECL